MLKAAGRREEVLTTLAKRGAKHLLSLGREERQRGDDNLALKNCRNTLSQHTIRQSQLPVFLCVCQGKLSTPLKQSYLDKLLFLLPLFSCLGAFSHFGANVIK